MLALRSLRSIPAVPSGRVGPSPLAWRNSQSFSSTKIAPSPSPRRGRNREINESPVQRLWHSQDVVAFEHKRTWIFRSASILACSWMGFSAWQGYDYVTHGIGFGLTIPTISLVCGGILLGATYQFAKYSVARLTLLRGGETCRITRHTLFGTEYDVDYPVRSLHLTTNEGSRAIYRFAVDGDTRTKYMVFDRKGKFLNNDAMTAIFRNSYITPED